MRARLVVALVALVFVALATAVWLGARARASDDPNAGDPGAPPPPRFASVKKVGEIANPEAGDAFGRDGCGSGLLGGRILYTFGDTIFFRTAADGARFRTNTAAYADLASPTVLHEPLDENGVPYPFIPHTEEEQAYNAAHGNRGDERWALWAGHVFPRPDGKGIVLFSHFKVHPGEFNWEGDGIGVAVVSPGATTAERVPGLLFTKTEPDFISAGMEHDGMLYLFGCERNDRCHVARAPIEGATSRASYTFWDGRGWSPDVAASVASVPGSGSGMSVAYNAKLDKFLMVTTAGFAKEIRARVADHVTGPWSASVVVYASPRHIYGGTQHEALDRDGGGRVYVSAYEDRGGFRGDIHLFEVTLAPAP